MNRPKIGLALGSGGAKGFSHIGVLKILHEHQIPVDYIAGSSMGALIGSLYGAGQTVDNLYRLAKIFRRKYFLDITVPKMGLIQGNRIKEYIRFFTFGKSLEDFHIPVAVVTTDLYTGEKVVFQQGDAADAVRASISVPGIFIPEKYGNRLLVDGGVIDRVPATVVKEMGADLVFAVDCAHFYKNTNVSSIYDVIMQSIDIMQGELVQQTVMDADIVMLPKLSQYSSTAFTNIEEIIREGEKEAEKHVDPMKKAIQKWKEKNHVQE